MRQWRRRERGEVLLDAVLDGGDQEERGGVGVVLRFPPSRTPQVQWIVWIGWDKVRNEWTQ
jgi:hypothetical protein